MHVFLVSLQDTQIKDNLFPNVLAVKKQDSNKINGNTNSEPRHHGVHEKSLSYVMTIVFYIINDIIINNILKSIYLIVADCYGMSFRPFSVYTSFNAFCTVYFLPRKILCV